MQHSELRSLNFTEEELKRLQYVSSGLFGAIYEDPENESAIKRYHEKLKDGHYYAVTTNPCLKTRKSKFKRLNKRDKRIKYSDVSVELIYIHGKFSGIRKKFYQGKTLTDSKYIPLVNKKNLVRDLIRNAEELTNNKIYNLDYKLNNILRTLQEEIKIIDLDDIFTKVTIFPNYYYKRKSLKKLTETIIYYFYEYQYNFSLDVCKRISNGVVNKTSLKKTMNYEQLEDFVNSIHFEGNIMIVEYADLVNIDLAVLKKYIEDNELSLVIAFKYDVLFSGEKAITIINKLNDFGIEVYDVFKYFKDYQQEVENYIISHDANNIHTYDEGFKVLEKK